MTTWTDHRGSRTGEASDRPELERRVDEVERQMRDLAEWLAAVADDLLERTGAA